MREGKREGKGTVFAILGAVSWGFSGTCSQYLFMHYEVDSGWLTAIRMLFAGLLLCCVVFVRRGRAMTDIWRVPGQAAKLLFFALAGLMFCQFTYLTAIQYSNSGTATVLQNLSVAIIAIIAAVRARALPDKKQLLSICFALLGVYLIATGGRPDSMVLSPQGLFWGICAAFGAVSYTMLSESLVARWGSLIVTGYGLLLGGAALSFFIRPWNSSVALDGTGFLMVVIIILVGTVGAFTFFLKGISQIGPVKAIMIGCLEPVSATLISALWLHSVFSIADLTGFACILTTVFLLSGPQKRTEHSSFFFKK